ncbi:hypothetical protein [Clostridium weizhouense]|uniref:Uncharacterized protein n=1 Tax=Clostridium weizhouense TaxID=2859781 RepID=A0ABS7ARR0_9CLOT|nr:hypothetical protein [Clostridium weizhouense]MBW6410175.1 hypothetical protein [Clostridium weizhouense]
MKKIILTMLIMLLTTILIVGYSNLSKNKSENLQVTANKTIGSINNSTNDNIPLEPTTPQWSLEQITGASMAEIDYASGDIVIFHGYFGLFVYDLNKLKIIRSLDLKPIHCNYTQGDSYCNVDVSKDGNTVQLHANDSKKMYVYSVCDNTLCETNYSPMENSFQCQLVNIEKAVGKRNGTFSYYAVEFDSGEYGYLTSDDETLGTLDYIRDNKIYKLFK